MGTRDDADRCHVASKVTSPHRASVDVSEPSNSVTTCKARSRRSRNAHSISARRHRLSDPWGIVALHILEAARCHRRCPFHSRPTSMARSLTRNGQPSYRRSRKLSAGSETPGREDCVAFWPRNSARVEKNKVAEVREPLFAPGRGGRVNSGAGPLILDIFRFQRAVTHMTLRLHKAIYCPRFS